MIGRRPKEIVGQLDRTSSRASRALCQPRDQRLAIPRNQEILSLSTKTERHWMESQVDAMCAADDECIDVQLAAAQQIRTEHGLRLLCCRWRHRGPCGRDEASGNAAGRTPGRARERSRPEQTSDGT